MLETLPAPRLACSGFRRHRHVKSFMRFEGNRQPQQARLLRSRLVVSVSKQNDFNPANCFINLARSCRVVNQLIIMRHISDRLQIARRRCSPPPDSVLPFLRTSANSSRHLCIAIRTFLRLCDLARGLFKSSSRLEILTEKPSYQWN